MQKESPARAAGFLHMEANVRRILGLDIGDKRIGVAVSDLLGLTAQGVETIFTKGMDSDVRRVCELARLYDTDRVAAGLPRRLSGEEGLQAGKVRAFAEKLEENGLSVRFVDERLTSVSAERLLIDAGVRRDKRKQVIDKLAATYILQAFLDMGGWQESAPQANDDTNETEVFRLMEGYSMEQDDIVTLLDEDGKECRFQHLMTLEFEQKNYVILAPAEEMEDIAPDEAVVLRIDTDKDGNDVYTSLTDEDEMERVFERYLAIAGEDEEEEE